MPNHVRNILKIKQLTPEKKQFILDNFTSDIEGEDIYPLNKIIDFNKIVPEPETEDTCPDKYKVNKASHITLIKEKPWFDWYKWHCDYWGTKWNAYNSYTMIGISTITFVFSTAWSTPYQIYKYLASYDFIFEVQYADEDLGNNCGKYICNPDKTGFADIVHFSESEIPNPRRFARRVWKY